MSGVTIAKVLSLIGMAPVKHAESVVFEKLRAAKSMFPRMDMTSMFSQVMNGNISALLQNPMAAITSQLTGVLGQITAQIPLNLLTSPIGVALTSLQTAAGDMLHTSNLLSGLTAPVDNEFGVMDVLSHIDILSKVSSVPSGIGLSQVLGPLNSAASVSNALDVLTSSSGTPLPYTAIPISDVLQHAGILSGIVSASTNAIATGQGAAQNFATIGAVANAIQQSSDDPDVTAYIRQIAQPQTLDAIPALQPRLTTTV